MSGFKIIDFSRIINNSELQKKYLFKIVLPSPIDIEQYNGQVILRENNSLYCVSNVSFPSSTTEIKTTPFFNSELKIAGKTVYNTWKATFRYDIANNQFPIAYFNNKLINLYQYFDFWRNAVHWEDERISSLPNVYQKTINIILLDENYQEKDEFKLEKAWPVSIETENLDYNVQNNFLLHFTVEFAINRYIMML